MGRPDEEKSEARFDLDPPFLCRGDLNRWRPAFDIQLANDVAEHEEGEDDMEEAGMHRRRVLRGIPPVHVPALDQRLTSAANALADELVRETAGRGRFRSVTPADLMHAAETLRRYRLSSSDVIRRMERDARRMFLSDLVELGRRFPPDAAGRATDGSLRAPDYEI